jgi:hypothetical protein
VSVRRTYRSGKIVATLDKDIGAELAALVDRASPGVREALTTAARQVVSDARERWPVSRREDRVHSRDLFEVSEQFSATQFRAVVSNSAPYAYFIRSMKNGLGGGSPWQILARRPALALAPRLALQISRVVGSKA